MIRKNLLKFKLNLKNHSSSSILSAFMKGFHADREQCPSCGARGFCHIFAWYKRWVIDIVDDKPACLELKICRVICSCGHTHAVLPDSLIPYNQYSLPFILYVLRLYFWHSMTVEEICAAFEITHSMLYRWKKTFATHQFWWTAFKHLEKASSSSFLDGILKTEPFTEFTSGFLQAFLYSFLQTHANPANCRHAVQGWPPSGPAPT